MAMGGRNSVTSTPIICVLDWSVSSAITNPVLLRWQDTEMFYLMSLAGKLGHSQNEGMRGETIRELWAVYGHLMVSTDWIGESHASQRGPTIGPVCCATEAPSKHIKKTRK